MISDHKLHVHLSALEKQIVLITLPEKKKNFKYAFYITGFKLLWSIVTLNSLYAHKKNS